MTYFFAGANITFLRLGGFEDFPTGSRVSTNENVYLSAIPSKAGIPWHQVLRDSRFRGSDDDYAVIDTLLGSREGEAQGLTDKPDT